ncbi:MAG: GntR family transcriptional regulator [Actinomycetota bacterium]|nr:GntR family transcriptional regulator [Actinomycetota bacterium]
MTTQHLVSRERPRLLSVQVAEVLRERVLSGELPPGARLVAEPELAVELEVSRGTLRSAVQRLVDEGLLTRLHGRGTFVASGGEELSLARLVTVTEVFMELKRPYRVEVLAKEVASPDPAVRRLLRLGRASKVLRIRRRFVVDGEPHVVVENRVSLAACPELADVDFRSKSLFGSLDERGVSITWGRRTFAAISDAAIAAELSAPASQPLLHIEQLSYAGDARPIEHSDTWARGDRLRLSTALRR